MFNFLQKIFKKREINEEAKEKLSNLSKESNKKDILVDDLVVCDFFPEDFIMATAMSFEIVLNCVESQLNIPKIKKIKIDFVCLRKVQPFLQNQTVDLFNQTPF